MITNGWTDEHGSTDSINHLDSEYTFNVISDTSPLGFYPHTDITIHLQLLCRAYKKNYTQVENKNDSQEVVFKYFKEFLKFYRL